jgi:hypothetical protein
MFATFKPSPCSLLFQNIFVSLIKGRLEVCEVEETDPLVHGFIARHLHQDKTEDGKGVVIT